MNPPIAGSARSEREIVMYAGAVALCPSCGHKGLVLIRVSPPETPAPDIAAIAEGYCAICYASTQIAFAAGPGWDDQPSPDDPRMATGDAPSTLIPESLFRLNTELAAGQLDELDPTNRAVSRAVAIDGVRDLVELAKFRRASGQALDAGERALLRRFADLVVASGDVLPHEVDAVVARDAAPDTR